MTKVLEEMTMVPLHLPGEKEYATIGGEIIKTPIHNYEGNDS